MWAVSRVVALPDFQGIGLVAYGFTDALGEIARAMGKRLLSHPAHPALIKARARSANWKMTTAPMLRGTSGKHAQRAHVNRRRIASFEYVGPKHADRKAAMRLWA